MLEKDENELKETLKLRKKEELKRRKQVALEKQIIQTQERSTEFTSVYISGLSNEDSSTWGINQIRDQLVYEFSRFGTIRKDEEGNIKCKFYTDIEGKINGDALIIYERPESVTLAVDMLNGFQLDKHTLNVQPAVFNNERKRSISDDNTDYDQINSNKRSKKSEESIIYESKSNNSNLRNDKESRKDRTTVLANVLDIYCDFEPDELEELKNDLLEGCQEIGEVLHINLDEVKGEAQVIFREKSDAEKCSKLMNKRFFDGRQILAYILDEEDKEDDSDDGEDSGSEDDNYDEEIDLVD